MCNALVKLIAAARPKMVPKAEHNHPSVLTASDHLTRSAERNYPMFFARAATLQATHRRPRPILVIFAPGVDETTALVFAGNMNGRRSSRRCLRQRPRQ